MGFFRIGAFETPAHFHPSGFVAINIAADAFAAKTKAGELKAVIDKWEAAFKELAAAPAAPAKAEAKKAEPKKK